MKKITAILSFLLASVVLTLTVFAGNAFVPEEYRHMIEKEEEPEQESYDGEIMLDGVSFQLPLTVNALEKRDYKEKEPAIELSVFADSTLHLFAQEKTGKSIYVSISENGDIESVTEVLFRSSRDEEGAYAPEEDIFFKDMDIFGFTFTADYGDIYNMFDEVYTGNSGECFAVVDDDTMLRFYTFDGTEKRTYPAGVKIQFKDPLSVQMVRGMYESGRLDKKTVSKNAEPLFPEAGIDIYCDTDGYDITLEADGYDESGVARFRCTYAPSENVLGYGLIIPAELIDDGHLSLARLGKDYYDTDSTLSYINDYDIESGSLYPSIFTVYPWYSDTWQIFPDGTAIVISTDVEINYFINDIYVSTDGGNTYIRLGQ